MHVMAVIALLVGRFQPFASPHFVLSMSSTRASNSQKSSDMDMPFGYPRISIPGSAH
jgi:hypothetical protein